MNDKEKTPQDDDEQEVLRRKRRLRRNRESKLRYLTSDLRSGSDEDGYETR